MSPWHSLFAVLYHWMLHRHVLHHHGIPSLFTVSCCWMLHRHESPWCSLFLYSVMPLDVTQCCITRVFPLSLQCHAVGCYAVLYHHGIPSFFSLSCCWMLHRHVLYHHGIPSFFTVSCCWMLYIQCCITMMFPLSLQCHAVGCYADMCCITVVFSLSFQWLFLPDPTIRSKLTLPPRAQVDYRAACFCHRQLIDIGYVCSVCLSSKCVHN